MIDKIEEVFKKGVNKVFCKLSVKNKIFYEFGILCWVKMDGYFFYFFEVIDENDEEEVFKNVI